MTSTSAPREEAVPASNQSAAGSAPGATAAPAVSGTRARAPRRSPADLPFRFADRALAEELASERGEPAWLRAERVAGSEAFEALPVESNQLYTPYVDLRGADLFDVRPYVRTASAPAQDEAPPDDVDGLIELAEDRVIAVGLSEAARAAGVVLETLAEALARDEVVVRGELEGAGSLPGHDKLAMLTRAFWSQGIRLAIPDGVMLERPVVIRWRSSTPQRALLTRTLVRLGAGASAAIVEEQLPSGPQIDCAAGEAVPQGLFTGTTEVSLGRDSSLAIASVQDLCDRQVAFQHRVASVGSGASLRWALAQLGGRLVRSRVDNRLVGDRASVEQVEIVFGGGEQLFDLTSYTRHVGRDTTGNLLSKGVLLDRARSYMKGLITIEKSAVGTDSFLGEFGMNLSKAARAVAIPSLEIDQPDCRRAAHSSSVGPIDPAQLFYLESRGIPPDEARKFVVLGFLEPVVARVPLDEAREDLRRLLDEKWAVGVGATAAGAAA